MSDELSVHVSRRELHDLDPPESFEAAGPFDVVLVNHGEALHVHLHLGDSLSEVATIAAANHYVEERSRRVVRVDVAVDRIPEEGVTGKLKVVSAYGAQTRWIDVTLAPPGTGDGSVEVDESLATPPPREDGPDDAPLANPAVPVLGLGALALLVAAVAAVLFRDAVVVLGSLAVVVGVAVAFALLVRG